jgi:hypothetical protein
MQRLNNEWMLQLEAINSVVRKTNKQFTLLRSNCPQREHSLCHKAKPSSKS